MFAFEVVAEILLIIVAIIGVTIEWQISRGNRLVGETKESLNDIKRQQNQNAQILEDKLTGLLNDINKDLDEVRRQQNQNAQNLENKLIGLLHSINKDIEQTANSNYQLSQNLSSSGVRIDAVLNDLRQTNLQLLARIEVLDRKVENGNGHDKGK